MTTMRSTIRELVRSLTPLDEIEKEHINFTLDWIDSGKDLFRLIKPSTPNIHLVAYSVVLSYDKKQILMTDHIRSGLWLPPGGHVEPNEHPQNTAMREAQEELGIEVEFHVEHPLFLTVTKTVGETPSHTDVSFWYLIKGDPDTTYVYDTTEFKQIRWYSIDELPFHCSDPHLKRFIQKIT